MNRAQVSVVYMVLEVPPLWLVPPRRVDASRAEPARASPAKAAAPGALVAFAAFFAAYHLVYLLVSNAYLASKDRVAFHAAHFMNMILGFLILRVASGLKLDDTGTGHVTQCIRAGNILLFPSRC